LLVSSCGRERCGGKGSGCGACSRIERGGLMGGIHELQRRAIGCRDAARSLHRRQLEHVFLKCAVRGCDSASISRRSPNDMLRTGLRSAERKKERAETVDRTRPMRTRSRTYRSKTGTRRPNDPEIDTAWLGREDSNLRMAESKSAALPLGYAPSFASPTRIRPRRLDHNARPGASQLGSARCPVHAAGHAAPLPREPPKVADTNQKTEPTTIPVRKSTRAKRISIVLAAPVRGR
jgi:hypothetical protein